MGGESLKLLNQQGSDGWFTDAFGVMSLDVVVQAPCRPTDMVIIECKPCCRFSANDVVPDLNSTGEACELVLIHPCMKSRSNHSTSQTWRQPLGSTRKAQATNPGGAQHDFYRRVGLKQFCEQVGVLEQPVLRRRNQIRPEALSPVTIFMVQDSVIVQVKHVSIFTFHMPPLLLTTHPPEVTRWA